MKRVFLSGVRSGLEVDRWAASNGFRLLSCRFNRKGAVVLYMEGRS